MITTRKTERGFRTFEFVDLYGEPCSLQKSSLADESAIWLGTSGQMVQGPPWKPYLPPEGVIVSSRMHLTQEMVRRLIPLLEHFANTGELPEE